jgi:hypothetical protein
MSGFMNTSLAPSPAPADPRKHVNYVLGMVLGVDDFNQEYAYLSGRDQLAARELAGYGVLRGLRVSTAVDATRGPEVLISAGVAITPHGQLVRVPLTQCAFLNDWIATHRSELNARGVAPPATLTLHAMLSYADRKTDFVPIPGEPCRSEDESMAESRVSDDFKLELRLDAPEQRQEEAGRAYLAWLASVPVVDDAAATALEPFLTRILDAAGRAPGPVIPAPGMPPQPVPSGTAIFDVAPTVSIPRSQVGAYLREAVLLYPTLRAAWLGAGASADGEEPNETALLLGSLRVPIVLDSLDASVWKVSSSTPIALDVARRSRLLPITYLQELVLAAEERTQRLAVSHALGAAGARYTIAAAGIVQIKAAETDPAPPGEATYNGLTAWASANGEVSLSFASPSGPGQSFVVKALPVASAVFSDATISFGAFLAAPPLAAGDAPRFSLSVRNGGTAPTQANLVGQQLVIEVSAYGVT